MTYGWMLLVVAIVGGAIFSLASPECLETSGFSNTGAYVEDFAVDGTTGNMTLVIANAESDSVELQSVEILSDDGSSLENVESFQVSPADTEPITLSQQFESAEECNTYDLNLVYDRGSLEGLEASGTITADVDVASSPNAPEIDSVEQ